MLPTAAGFVPSEHTPFEWTAFWFTVGGSLLTLVGLVLTYFEARAARQRAGEARTAADAAKDAAASTMNAVTERMTIADLGELRQDLLAILSALEDHKHDIALREIRAVRVRVGELRERRGFEAHKIDVQALVVDIASIQRSIERHTWGRDGANIDMDSISTTLFEHIDSISGWTEQLRFPEPKPEE